MQIQRLTVAAEVFKTMQEWIISGKYKAGSILPSQDQLAKYMGVSRPTIREAINRLAALGMVEPRQGFGTIILPYKGEEDILERGKNFKITPEDIVDIAVIRLAVERVIVRLAAVRAEQHDLDLIRENLKMQKKLLKSENEEFFAKEDLNFHQLLGRASKSPQLQRIFELNLERFYKFVISVLKSPFSRSRAYSRHYNIFEAIVAKDPNKAEQYAIEHITMVLNSIPKDSNPHLSSALNALF